MKKKIIGLFICITMVIATLPLVTSLTKSKIIQMTSMDTIQRYSLENFIEEQKLLASDGADGDGFSWTVCINKDSAIIGAPFNDDFGEMSGSAYVFIRTGSVWTQQAKLVASDNEFNDQFGRSVAIANDTAFVGATQNVGTGSVYVFTRSGNTWTEQGKIIALDGTLNDYFGCSVSVDNDYLIVGAWGDDIYGSQSGSAYIFNRSGSSWIQQTKLVPLEGDALENFGYSVSISNDTVVIGAPDDSGEGDTGSAYVFIRTGSVWTQQAKLVASDGAVRDSFGFSVSIHNDTVLIGARWDDDKGSQSGSAYIFNRVGTIWTQQAQFLASDGVAEDLFGWSVSLNGQTALIGAICDDDNGENCGSAYIFTRNSTTWTQQQKLLASDGTAGNSFGFHVFFDGKNILIGSSGENNFTGSAYVFIKESENQPPYLPSIEGETIGKVGNLYEYTFVTTDPDGDNVYYYINWTDGTPEVTIGPFISGTEAIATHSWSKKGTYVIKAKARDIHGAESDWATLSVIMPLSFNIPFQSFWERLFERFPHAFPILRHLMGY